MTQNRASHARARDLITPAEPRERPILFSAPMVRAVLDGSKTETRRVVRVPGGWELRVDRDRAFLGQNRPRGFVAHKELSCPYGRPGDRLWVREAWCAPDPMSRRLVVYRADLDEVQLEEERLARLDMGCETHARWWPSIHMPRWASRITLEVVCVRVQRLQDISDNDVKAEGALGYVGAMRVNGEAATGFISPRYRFAGLWNAINEKRPGCTWLDNPWVWAVTFKRLGDD